MRSLSRLAALGLLAVAACGGGGGGGAPDAPPEDEPGDPFAPSGARILVAEDLGDFNGAPNPVGVVLAELSEHAPNPFHRETARAGDCRLLEFELGTCPTPCEGGICTTHGCVTWPTPLEAGAEIEITGTHAGITLMHDAASGLYYSGAVPAELFDAGDAITAAIPGGLDLPELAITAHAPTALATSITSPLALPHADDVELTWTAADDGWMFLSMSSANAGHGLPYDAIVECAGPDDGSLTVPGAFVEKLGVLGGYPCLVGHECSPAVLTRYHRKLASTPAVNVELWVASRRAFYVSHDAQ